MPFHMLFHAGALLSSLLSAAPLAPIIPTWNYDPYMTDGSGNDWDTPGPGSSGLDFDLDMSYTNKSSNREGSKENKDNQYSMRAGDDMLEDSLRDTIMTGKTNVMWADVAGLRAAKRELQIAAVMPIKHPKLFRGKREPAKCILLYGPPGTGKGQLVKALASEVDSTLFTVSNSDIASKWVGESERMVRLLFKMAREQRPSIIFLDEIDGVCGSRDGWSASEHSNKVKTEFLAQMDGVGVDNTGVLIMAATNLPWALDPAFLRRFDKKIHIPLPDEHARRDMFRIKVGGECRGLSWGDYCELGRKTQGFSGSDISKLVQEALKGPINRLYEATHFSIGPVSKKFSPCKPDQEGAILITWEQVPSGKLEEPEVMRSDFFNALAKAKPSINPDGLQKYSEWTQQYVRKLLF